MVIAEKGEEGGRGDNLSRYLLYSYPKRIIRRARNYPALATLQWLGTSCRDFFST